MNTHQWHWMMAWCRERHLAPGERQNWDKASLAYKEHLDATPIPSCAENAEGGDR
jgi:hypothetical protein